MEARRVRGPGGCRFESCHLDKGQRPFGGPGGSSSNQVQSNWLSARRLRVRVPSNAARYLPLLTERIGQRGQMTRWVYGYDLEALNFQNRVRVPVESLTPDPGPGGQPACKAGVQWTSEVRSLGPVRPAVVV